MYTVTLTVTSATAPSAQKRRSTFRVPESPWKVSAYGRPTEQNLQRFIAAWERRARRRQPVRVTRALIIRRKGTSPGVVAMYSHTKPS